jgi:ribosomal-protein-alanine N-acetyltransferase
VELVRLSRAMVDALLVGPEDFTRAFGWTVVEGYLDFPEVLPRLRDALPAGDPPPWGTLLFVDPDARELVGLGGFKGPPVAGAVEIGYSIAPARRRRGLARAAAIAMIDEARAAGLTTVVAQTLAEPNASNRLLEQLDFVWCAETTDDDVGATWRYELDLTIVEPHR